MVYYFRPLPVFDGEIKVFASHGINQILLCQNPIDLFRCQRENKIYLTKLSA